MSDNSDLSQQQLNRKHADEWSAFDSFHDNMLQLVKLRHHQEKTKYNSLTSPAALADRHRRELAELVQAKALAAKLLCEEQAAEEMNLKREYEKK